VLSIDPQKLDLLADWLTRHDTTGNSEVQDDLRRWAEELRQLSAATARCAMDNEALIAEARSYALKATPGPCQFGYLGSDGEPYTDPQRIKEAMGTMIDLAVEHGDSVRGCFLVTTGDAEDPVTVAITGNGPTSEANAQFFAGARECVLKLCAALAAASSRPYQRSAMSEQIEYRVQCKKKRGKVWHDLYAKTQSLKQAKELLVKERSGLFTKEYDYRAIKRTTVTTITEDVL
jgi:hypothetical protein